MAIRTTSGARATRWSARAVCLVAASVLVGTTCTSAPERSGPSAPAPPDGSILAFTDDPDESPLVAFDVRRGTVGPVGSTIRSPVAAAAATEDGAVTAVLVSPGGVATVVRIRPGTAPSSVGPELRGPSDADFRSVSIVGDRALVADCREVSILETDGGVGWRRVGRGCWAALAPDASTIVYSPDGRTVLEARTGGTGRPRPLFDVASFVDLGGRGSARLFGAPAWGADGLAFAATWGDQVGVFLREPGGRVRRLFQEALVKTARPPILVWQPGGSVLAMMDDLGTGGVLRTFDASGAHRVIALDAIGFEGLLWSPDGSSLATLTSAGALLVVGTDDVWRLRVETEWTSMLGWRP